MFPPIVMTYHLITATLADLLSHQLIDPLGLIAHGGIDTRNNERHNDEPEMSR